MAMIGAPIAHAHLPGRFNAWFREAGVDAMMVPLAVTPERVDLFFNALRGWENCCGVVVTAPHKQAAARAADRLSERAARLGAANVLTRSAEGQLVGDNLDGAGFVHGLSSAGRSPSGARVILLGCGGAGAAIALALAEGGAGDIVLSDVDGMRAERLGAMLSDAGYAASGVVSQADVVLADQWRGADLAINATPLGSDGVSSPLPPNVLDACRPGALIADVIARPAATPWLKAAQARGLPTLGGAAMAEGQFDLIARAMGFV